MKHESDIKILPPLLVNKIAAGEVVERPASVVKELLDNAIDAGATRIVLTIEDGGKRLIRVTDDGCGMTEADLHLAVTPHATSKIQEENDLYNIASMGFRGEALASISSVSKMKIVSRKHAEDEGCELNIAGVDKKSAQAAGCPAGTTIEIRDLFFNVPARRKFLRATSTETGHIHEHFARAALAFPGITFELNNNGRRTHLLPTCDNRQARMAKFYGAELADNLMPAQREERGLRIEAYLAPPDRSRANAQWQYTFVNDRYIRDKYVQHAIKEAYRGLVEHNRHAVVFIFIYMDPHQVDINVHPTKIEVRWADSNMVHSQVLSLLKETLQRADLTPFLRTDRALQREANPAEEQRMREELAFMLKQASPVQGPSSTLPHRPGGSAQQASSMPRHELYGHGNDPMESWRKLYDRGESRDRVDAALHQPAGGTGSPFVRPRAMQMHNLYLVAETEDGIIIIDQHALHERVMYEQLKDMLSRGPLESQRLLMPQTFPATASQMALLTEHQALLENLGIEVQPFGPDTAGVHAFPVLLKNTDIPAFMTDLLDQLTGKPDGSAEVAIHDVLDMMACKAAVKAGDPLTQPEIEALIEQRHLVEKSSNCPHGRPTTLRLTKADLNRQFKRT
ncbi:MAG: DNA mismatch repair endonuclease MutL [Planctomycetota bacterium]|jgi:DNA mismatch repair protein MutL